MTVTDVTDPNPTSLDTAAARKLSTTTKTTPQMQAVSPRWLLRKLPWLAIDAGTYRVNRRLNLTIGDGRVSFVQTGSDVQVIPAELSELPALRSFTEAGVLTALAGRFEQRRVEAGQVLAEFGAPIDEVILVAHGKVRQLVPGNFDEPALLGVLADGDQAGSSLLTDRGGIWEHTLRAVTPCVLLTLSRRALEEILDAAPTLREHLEQLTAGPDPAPRNKYGEAAVELAAGHHGEPVLPSTFVDYEPAPREYELSVTQTVLRVHTRVADLYSKPMDQTQQQVHLAVQELKERQEHELLNHPDFGLLHNAAFSQRLQTRSGPPSPDDFDELLSRRRSTEFFLAHPQAIAAFRRQCTARGLYPGDALVDGQPCTAWRGVPVLPSNKIPVSAQGTTSVLAMRVGEESNGVVGLRPTALPDEIEPGLNVRFTGIDDRAVSSYLVSAYFSAAVLVPDALGVLENVEIGR